MPSGCQVLGSGASGHQLEEGVNTVKKMSLRGCQEVQGVKSATVCQEDVKEDVKKESRENQEDVKNMLRRCQEGFSNISRG